VIQAYRLSISGIVSFSEDDDDLRNKLLSSQDEETIELAKIEIDEQATQVVVKMEKI
jgi:hypothetical protein